MSAQALSLLYEKRERAKSRSAAQLRKRHVWLLEAQREHASESVGATLSATS